MFKRILIANRGEIACRVIRAAHALGVEAVAVYSDADRDALHVRMADEAVHVGPTPSAQSYLDQDKILEAATQTGAQAIHPGYGFLSENAGFAQKVIDAGLTWIGPSPAAMETMGDKTKARAEAEAAGVPVAPGSGVLKDASDAKKHAEQIGFPVMLKAAAGGGGIGMRIVRDPEDLAGEFESATKQAASAFGVPDVFLEKFIERPRHIEVQVLADAHGTCLHLFERECSIQRRHQKLIEEAPSPALTEEQRRDIGARAVALAQRVGYVNAGTLEFLYENGQFYFNEMNTRLQVEHPVTEAITGVDLVQWQLRIASGEALDLTQDDIKINGHAIECRINAEDPRQGFMPSPGTVRRLRLPEGRVDGCLYPGWTVPDAYDSMVLKLINHGPDREAAIKATRAALRDLTIDGFTTNVDFHRALMANTQFIAADVSTRFLEEHDVLGEATTDLEKAQAAALVLALNRAPGGVAAVATRQQRPPVIDRRPGQRRWT